MGAMIRAVAALLITSDKHMVTTINNATMLQTGMLSVRLFTAVAISPVNPVDCKAPLTGIMAPNSTITGQSISRYKSRNGRIPKNTYARIAPRKDSVVGMILNMLKRIAATKIATAIVILEKIPTRTSRSARGKRCRLAACSSILSCAPCSSSTSPTRNSTSPKRF